MFCPQQFLTKTGSSMCGYCALPEFTIISSWVFQDRRFNLKLGSGRQAGGSRDSRTLNQAITIAHSHWLIKEDGALWSGYAKSSGSRARNMEFKGVTASMVPNLF